MLTIPGDPQTTADHTGQLRTVTQPLQVSDAIAQEMLTFFFVSKRWQYDDGLELIRDRLRRWRQAIRREQDTLSVEPPATPSAEPASRAGAPAWLPQAIEARLHGASFRELAALVGEPEATVRRHVKLALTTQEAVPA